MYKTKQVKKNVSTVQRDWEASTVPRVLQCFAASSSRRLLKMTRNFVRWTRRFFELRVTMCVSGSDVTIWTTVEHRLITAIIQNKAQLSTNYLQNKWISIMNEINENEVKKKRKIKWKFCFTWNCPVESCRKHLYPVA